MDVTAGITDVLVHVGEEGDHVVAHLGFDLEDALHLEAGLGLDRVQGLLGHAAEPAVGFGGGDLHIQPALEFGLLYSRRPPSRAGCSARSPDDAVRQPTTLWIGVAHKKAPPIGGA